jgi:hypothetical protein
MDLGYPRLTVSWMDGFGSDEVKSWTGHGLGHLKLDISWSAVI